MPYFINLAPNYDLTLIPTYLSKQGLLGEVDWRQRLSNGDLQHSRDRDRPAAARRIPRLSLRRGRLPRVRGSIEAAGNFLLNDMWQFGWNGTWMSDKFFLNDYRLQGINFDNFYFQDVISSVYLRGQAAQSFFDLSAYHFEGTTASDDNRTLPVAVAPVFDFNRVINVPADRTYGIGGELTIDTNVANINQTNAAFQSTGLQTFDNAYHLYNVCETQVGSTSFVNTYFPGKCLLRGIAGDYTRATGQLSWQRSYIDPIGEVWKPFLFGRLDGEATELNETGSITYASSIGVSTVANSSQAAFFSGSNQGAFARGMAGAGLEYRYPFVSTSSWGTQTITPIAQFIARPSEVIPRIQPDEDSQSLVFDETNLFAWNKFSGYDRVEGGTTAQLWPAVHRRLRQRRAREFRRRRIDPGRRAELLYPLRSRQRRPRVRPRQDILQLRLRRDAAADLEPDYVDEQTAVRQLDAAARSASTASPGRNFAGVSGSVDYALYAAQPALGWEFPREGLTGNLGYKFQDRWSVDGSLVLDMSRHYYDTLGQTTPILYPVGYSLGVGYKDDCTTLTIRYSSNVSQPAVYTEFPGGPVIYNPATRNQTLMFELVLRTLGDVKANVGVGAIAGICEAASQAMTGDKAPLAMTMGDPAGIGPELALAAWRDRTGGAPFFVFAAPAVLAAAARRAGVATPVIETDPAGAAAAFSRGLPVVALKSPVEDAPGRPTAANAAATIESIARAVEAVHHGAARAVVTNPIAKSRALRSRVPVPRAYRISGRTRQGLGRARRFR